MAGDTLDVGVKLQLADLQKQLAQIPGMTAEQAKLMVAELNKSVKAAEKAASTAAKAAGGASKKVVDEAKKAAEDFSKTAGGLGGNIQKLSGLLDSVVPGAGRFVGALADIGDGAEVAGDLAGGLGTTLGGLAATFGPLVIAVAALSAAYAVQKREVDRLIASRQFEHDIAKSLLPAERALEDAKIAEAVATGQLTAAEGAEEAARRKAERSIKDFFEAQKKSREELNETIESSKKYITLQHGLAAALAITFDLTTGLGVTLGRMAASGKSLSETIKEDILALDGMIDSVTGLESGSADAKGKIKALDQAVRDEAAAVKEGREATIAADQANRAKTAGDKAAADAIRDQTAAYEESKKAIEEDAALTAQFAAGLAGLQAVGDKASESMLEGEARLAAARDLALKQLLEQYQATLQLAGSDQDRLKASQAYEASKLAIVQQSEIEIAKVRSGAEAQAKKERDDALKKRLDGERAARDAYVSLAKDGLSKVAELTAQASAKNAEVATALQAQLVAGQGIYTAAQEAALKKRIASARAAALREFAISKGLSIATATINVAEGVSKALAGPLPLIRAGLVAAAGGAQIAAIAAQQPAFHAGGVFDPDEGQATLRRGEYVVPPVARSVLGDDTLRRASAGVPSSSSQVVAIQVYGHSHIVDRYETDRLRVGGPLAVAIKKGSKPGMGGL